MIVIREFKNKDMNDILDIWLSVSIKAHSFVKSSYWQSQVKNMRDIYIPSAKTFVILKDYKIVGFYSLYENTLAAIFVKNEFQGLGLGKKLLEHAKEQTDELFLTVYKKNTSSYNFYLSQGFKVIKEQIDEGSLEYEYKMRFER